MVGAALDHGEHPVIGAQFALFDLDEVGGGSRHAGVGDPGRDMVAVFAPQDGGGAGVVRVGDRLAPRPAARVAGHDGPAGREGHDDLARAGGDVDAFADGQRVYGVVAGVDADVVVAADAGVEAEPAGRIDRRQCERAGPVGFPPLGGAGAQAALDAPVGDGQPVGELGVEVVRAGESAAGQKARLQIAVRPLDEALRFGVAGAAREDLDGQHPGESRELRGEFALADARLVVPDQHLRHRLPALEQLPVPVDQIARHPRRQHHRGDHPGVARDHDQRRRPAGLAHARHTSVQAEVPESLSAESWREVLEVVAEADRFGLLATSLYGRTLWAVVRKAVPSTGDVGGPSHQR